MTDVCVTVPMRLWDQWIGEGDLPGEPWSGYENQFWFFGPLPEMSPGDRVYIVAHGLLRGYAPLVRIETTCCLRPSAHCLVRRGDAVAVTIARSIRGFRGWQYRDWKYEEERPFPEWALADTTRHTGPAPARVIR